ncbi:uncharacterized protein ACO6RY_03188 [Pungitius sinensis]
MASEPSWPDAQSGTLETQHPLSLLDVLHANQFEGQSFTSELFPQTEKSFYSGAPPTWLNFHISDQSESGFIKRDGYAALVEKVRDSRKKRGISTVKLFHQPGCGGTTLAMKVLWDLRKEFKCAVLTGSTSNVTKVAEEVVQLFTAGGRRSYKTVLLLVNDQTVLDLKDAVRVKMQQVPFATKMVLLSCVRKDEVQHSDNVVLQKVLSEHEKHNFNAKKEELWKIYGEQCGRFHGFNIIQKDFSPAYVEEACSVFKPTKRANKPRKTQLAAFLSLLNAYVPDSFLLESQCRDFFQHGADRHQDFSLEDRMQPFSHLIVTFQRDERSDKKVRMAHPLIAQRCTELMAESGVTRSDTARNLLTYLCRDQFLPHLVVGFVKDMLTKRGPKPKQKNRTQGPINATQTQEDPERYARLILDIQRMESGKESASVLKVASNVFAGDAFIPQALARFYYTELKDYNLAEMWASRAKQRDPRNSFVADTLGQVHKNHLKNTQRPIDPCLVLQLASKAIEAFKDEERLAENECDANATGDGNTKVSHHFNNRGQFGYLQLCNDVFDLLVSQNDTWREVLTKKVSLHSALESLGDKRLMRFNDLISSFRDEIQRKCDFFNKYLTYSKPKLNDDPDYISQDTSGCYKNFVGSYPSEYFKQKGAVLIRKLRKLVDTSAGVLSCLERECNESDLKEVTTWWEQIFLQKESISYIVALVALRNNSSEFKQKMPAIPDNSPEHHMLALLLCWPADGEARCLLDLGELIQRMKRSFENAYENHLRSRYLRPLFFMGNGKGLDRIVYRKVLENLLLEQNQETEQDWNNNWIEEKIFRDPNVQARLVKVEGVVRSYQLFATVGGKEIELEANNQDILWRPRQVSFYLGFTIRGPVAFAVHKAPPPNKAEENSMMNFPEDKPEGVTGE